MSNQKNYQIGDDMEQDYHAGITIEEARKLARSWPDDGAWVLVRIYEVEDDQDDGWVWIETVEVRRSEEKS